MTVLLLRLKADARARWRAWLGLAIVTGLVGGATIAALAGARRTETAYDRFLRATRAFDVMVTNGGTTPDNINRQFDFTQLARLPEVADAVQVNYYFPKGTTQSGKALTPGDITPLASPDRRFGADLNGARALEGRLPTGEDEVAVTFVAAQNFGIRLGETMSLQLGSPQAFFGATANGDPAAGVPAQTFRVVGIVAMQGGFPPLTGGLPPLVLLSGRYAGAHPDASHVLAVRLRAGTRGIAAFEAELHRRAGGGQVVTTNAIELTSAVQRSLGVQAAALRLLAVLAGVVAMLLLAQALAREGSADAGDNPTLRALGTTTSQLAAFGLGRAVAIAVGAGIVAAVTAVALSPLSPFGVARQAELHPGVDVNVAYVVGGAIALFLLIAALGGLTSWWSGRPGGVAQPLEPRPGSRFASALARAGFPPSAVSGASMALGRGHGRSTVPVRSTVLTVALGIAIVAVALSFSASLQSLFHDPRLYGWNWDVQIGDAFAPDLLGEAQRLNADPAVLAVAVGTMSRLQIGQLGVDTLGSDALTGTIGPVVVEGRAPTAPTEILLGTRTLKSLGAHIGDVVPVGFGDRTLPMRVVGRGVLTEFAGGARLGEGAAVTVAGMRSIEPDVLSDVVLLRLRPGPGRSALLKQLADKPPGNLYLPSEPSDLVSLARVGGLPSVVAGLLALMAMATMAHTLMLSVRRRRRDLAILKVLGFVRSQVAATLAWQSSVVAVLAVALGLPSGFAAGRLAWRVFAERLGVPPQPATPLLSMALLIPAAVLLANFVAVVPATLAARTRPSVMLRSE
jgi:hypothetical protein